MRKSLPLDYETKYYTVKGSQIKTGDLVRKQIALAILNKDTGKVLSKSLGQESEIKIIKTGIINLEIIPPISVAHSLKVNWWNSFNTDYAILTGRNWLSSRINIYFLVSTYPVCRRKQPVNIRISSMFRIQKLHLPEIIEAGKAYLEKNIEQAFWNGNGQVKSRSLRVR